MLYKIDIFAPPKFNNKKFDIKLLESFMKKKMIYASMGRFALYQVLISLNVRGPLLLPVYACESLLWATKKLNIEVIFYDVDITDLNADLDSIKKLSKKFNCEALLVASMYGNPANLIEIEQYCFDNQIILIDDAAQSFSATLNNRPVGSFGDAGFFSFSPGKPAASHMGAFFWSKKMFISTEPNIFFTI